MADLQSRDIEKAVTKGIAAFFKEMNKLGAFTSSNGADPEEDPDDLDPEDEDENDPEEDDELDDDEGGDEDDEVDDDEDDEDDDEVNDDDEDEEDDEGASALEVGDEVAFYFDGEFYGGTLSEYDEDEDTWTVTYETEDDEEADTEVKTELIAPANDDDAQKAIQKAIIKAQSKPRRGKKKTTKKKTTRTAREGKKRGGARASAQASTDDKEKAKAKRRQALVRRLPMDRTKMKALKRQDQVMLASVIGVKNTKVKTPQLISAMLTAQKRYLKTKGK